MTEQLLDCMCVPSFVCLWHYINLEEDDQQVAPTPISYLQRNRPYVFTRYLFRLYNLLDWSTLILSDNKSNNNAVMEIPLDVVMEKTSLEEKTSSVDTGRCMDLFTCLSGCRRASDGTDITSLLTSGHAQSCRKCVWKCEDLEKSVIETMPVVNSF